MERIESHSEGSTSTLTTCSATSSVDFSEDDGVEMSESVGSHSPSFLLSGMRNDESFSSFGFSSFKKMKRSRVDVHSTKVSSLAETITFCEKASQAKHQNVPLLRPVARYLQNMHSQDLLTKSSDRQVPPKSMCAALGMFRPVQARFGGGDVTARKAFRADPSGRDRPKVDDNNDLEGEDDAELASFFQTNSEKSGAAVLVEEVISRSSYEYVIHREATCDPLMCIFNMDL